MSEENKNVRCDLCGEEISSQNAIRFDGTILCTDCFNQRSDGVQSLRQKYMA